MLTNFERKIETVIVYKIVRVFVLRQNQTFKQTLFAIEQIQNLD